MTIGKNIKQIRLCRNYSQKYVAQVLGTSHANYGKMENGAIRISPQRLEHIAAILQVTLEELIAPLQEAQPEDTLVKP